jgi:hypothetical protein
MTNRTSIPAEIEREILIECGHRCAVDGAPLSLEHAHIIPWHESKEYKAEDLICLCASCHERADKEKWGEKTLVEYKQRPWVMRQNREVNNIFVTNTTRITLTIEGLPPDFNETSQRLLPFALAGLLGIPPYDIHIVSVKDDIHINNHEKAYSRYSYLIDKMFLEALSIEEEIEMKKLEEQLDSAEAKFYEPIKHLLVAKLNELTEKKTSKGG